MPVQFNYFPVCYKRQGKFIIIRKISAKHQGGTEYGKEGHHRILLIFSEPGGSVFSSFSTDSNMPDRQHISIRPGTCRNIRRPSFKYLKLLLKLFPVVPEITDSTPHICILLNMADPFKRSRSRRHAQNNFSSAPVDSLPDHFNLLSMIRRREIIDFQKIHTP